MNDRTPALRPARTLDRYGATSRCLLHLLENAGNPTLSDDAFLRRFAGQFPHWETRPGELDGDSLGIVAQALGLAAKIATTHDYDAVLLAHRFGHAVIVLTDRAPLQQAQDTASQAHAMVLEQIDEDGFVVWCPFASGASDLLPRADRQWWLRWRAEALVLHAPHA